MTTRIRWIDKWSAASTDEWEAAEVEILIGGEWRHYCPFIARVADPQGQRWLHSIDVLADRGGGAWSVANGITSSRTKAKKAAEQAIRRLATGPKLAA